MARDFDGASDYLSHAAAVVAAPPFTLAARFNIDSYAAFNTLMSVMAAASGQGHHMSILTDGRGAAQSRDSSGIFRNAFSSNTYTAGTWGSCVGRYASTTSREVILNGDVANGGINNISSAPAALDITECGRFEPTGTSFLNGRGAELAIWDAVLDDEEVRAYDDGVSPRLIRPQSLVAYWPLLGNGSPEPDPIGGFAFTLNGTPAKAEHPRVFMPKKKRLWVFIPGTSVYNIPISASSISTARVQRQANLIVPTASTSRAITTRIGQLLKAMWSTCKATIVEQSPTITHIAISVSTTSAALLSLTRDLARRPFSGGAGLGIHLPMPRRWRRRKR